MMGIMLYCRVWHSRRLYSLIFSTSECTRSNSKVIIYIKSLVLHCNSGNKTNISVIIRGLNAYKTSNNTLTVICILKCQKVRTIIK